MTSKLVSDHERFIKQANRPIQKEPFKPVILARKTLWFYDHHLRFVASHKAQRLSDDQFYFVLERQKQLKACLF